MSQAQRLTPQQQAALVRLRDVGGRFVRRPVFDTFPAGSLPAIRMDTHSIVPEAVHDVLGNGDCFYNAFEYLRPVPVDPDRPGYELTINERSLAQRVEMSDFFRDAVARGEGWTRNDHFRQLYRDHNDRVPEEVEPEEFGLDILRDGWDGHWGESFEAEIWARLHLTNVAIVVVSTTVTNTPTGPQRASTQQLHIYPVREDTELHNPFVENPTLNPAYPTVVLQYESTETGVREPVPGQEGRTRFVPTEARREHYQVVRSFQLAPANTDQAPPGAEVIVSERLRAERVQPARQTRFTTSGGRIRTASVDASEERDTSVGPTGRRRGRPAARNLLQSDCFNNSSFVYRYTTDVTKNQSHDFPPNKSFAPVTTQRMINDGNSFFRTLAYMRWGDQDRWREMRELLAQYLLEQWESGAPWTDDEALRRITRVDADGHVTQQVVQTPEVFAADMLDPAHPGTDPEWHIACRLFKFNIVVAFKELVEGRDELWYVRFPMQERDEPNQLADRLEPKRDTGVVLIDGSHWDVVTSFKVADEGGRVRANAQLKRCIAQPAPERVAKLPTRESIRQAAVEARERMQEECQRQYALDQQRQKDQAARERSNLPRLDPPQGHMCHTRVSHRDAMAGCAGRDVNHQVEYFDVGGFTCTCPFGCGALHLRSEYEKLAKPRADGSVSAGLMTKCCRNGRTDTDEMRRINRILANPPRIIKEISDPSGPHPEAKVALQDAIKINNAFAFASVSTVTKNAPAHGVQPIIANGEFKWRLSDLYPPDAKRDQPAFGQYYVLTPEEALERRLAANEIYRPRLSQQSMEAIDAAIRSSHPLAELYHTADEMFQQAIRERGEGQPLPQFEIVLLTNREAQAAELADPSIHAHRTELPQGGGEEAVALIWMNDEGTVNPVEKKRGVRLHGRAGGIVDMHHMNPNIFAACYPYLNPHGLQGYRYGMRYADTPAALNPTDAVDPNAVFAEDDPDEPALMVDDADRQLLPKRREFMSIRDWFGNVLAFRSDPKTGYHFATDKGPLGEQYILNACVQVEQHEQEQRREHAQDLRSVLPQELIDSLQRGLPAGETLGKIYFATEKWKGSRRHMQQAYADAMAMFAKLGAPQLFLTFTGNPNWPEIQALLKNGQSYIHNAPAVTRIFWEKFEELKKDIIERQIFGPVKCFVFSVEHQKRGMPHIHMLITLDRERLAISPNFVDNLISAEIPAEPDKEDRSAEARQQQRLRELVGKHQMHSCSDYCLRDDGNCEKRFPREYSADTVTGEGHTRYKRRAPDEGGEIIRMERRGHAQLLSNQFVVPYNEFLLLKYGSHHNLEWIGNYEQAVEYVLKYLMKGGDMAYVQITKADGTKTGVTDYDEVKQMFKVRFLTAMEAQMRLDGRPVTKASHTVHKLWVHSPNSANMVIEEGHEEEALPAAEAAVEGGGRRTMLTAFLDRCAHPESDAVIEREGYVTGRKANELLYEEFPRFYHFNRMERQWIRRKRFDGTAEEFLARLGSVNAKNAELTAIRILLQNTPGPTSWNDLKTVRDADGQLHTYFPNDPERGYHEAATARGLLENNSVWIRTLEEADRERMGCRAFRRFFASTLVHSIPPDRQALFEHFVNSISQRRGNETREQQTERAYQLLEHIFRQWDSTCRDNGLRGPASYNERDVERELERAAQTEPGTQYVADDPDAHRSRDWWRRYADANIQRLNAGQRAIFNRIVESVTNPSARSLFEVKGEGGTGKTFLFNTLIAEMHSRGEVIVATGTTGVAATLLLTGRTAHSAFRIAIDVDSTDLPRISGQEQLAQRLRKARLIIIDEMTMMNKDILNYIDRTLRSLYTGPEKDLPYAGKAVCLSGDWKQRLPIVKGAKRPAIVQSTIKFSDTYHLFEKLTLTENMRIDPAEREYQEWTRLVGNGLNFVEEGSELIEIDERNLVRSAQQLIDFVFPPHVVADPMRFADEIAYSAVLCYTNDNVDRLNAELMARIPGEEFVLRSIDRPLNVANNNLLNVHNADQNLEHIHSKRPGNVPPHILRLKKGCIAILTKNLDIESGLCNGTRLQVVDVKHPQAEERGAQQPMPMVTCRVLTGKSKDKLISLIPSRFTQGLERNSRETPFERIQIPILPAFVMTADKAQGQTLTRVGLHLVEKEAFAHGHVYVPITRVKNRASLKILPQRVNEAFNLIRNVVWPEVLDPEDRAQVVRRDDDVQPPPPPPAPPAEGGDGGRTVETEPGRRTRGRSVDVHRPHRIACREEQSGVQSRVADDVGGSAAVQEVVEVLAESGADEEAMETDNIEPAVNANERDAERADREEWMDKLQEQLRELDRKKAAEREEQRDREKLMGRLQEQMRHLDAVRSPAVQRTPGKPIDWTKEGLQEQLRQLAEKNREFDRSKAAERAAREAEDQRLADLQILREQNHQLDAKDAADAERAQRDKDAWEEYLRGREAEKAAKAAQAAKTKPDLLFR